MLSQTQILGIFLELPPANLQAVELMKLHRPAPGRLFPDAEAIPEGTVIAATIELIEYTQRCASAVYKLHELGPRPLQTLSILEYSL